jgi:hypothetical protein
MRDKKITIKGTEKGMKVKKKTKAMLTERNGINRIIKSNIKGTKAVVKDEGKRGTDQEKKKKMKNNINDHSIKKIKPVCLAQSLIVVALGRN